jgi:hypothetical protein
MFRKTMIVRCGWLRVKLVTPTSQTAALFYGRPF